MSYGRDVGNEGPKYVIFMVGLPACGKSYIAKKLARYLVWVGFDAKVFNVGDRRRLEAHITPALDPLSTTHDSSFFDAHNVEASVMREKLAMDSLEDVIKWLHGGGKVAILDATNSTKVRRRILRDRALSEKNFKCFFIESICPDSQILEENIQMKLKSPDYLKMIPANAIADFRRRRANYEKVYQTIQDDEDLPYIQIYNVGQKIVAHRINGYLPGQCSFYLSQFHVVKRTIWLTRHGESVYNVEGRIGQNPPLTEAGKAYAKALHLFISTRNEGIQDTKHDFDRRRASLPVLDGIRLLRVFTSTLERAVSTAKYFDPSLYDVAHVKLLNEINNGLYEGLTNEEVIEKYPDEQVAREKNKVLYRSPGAAGESIADVIERLKPFIIELERMKVDSLCISHQVVMKTLLAYFTGHSLTEVTAIPLHTLYCLQPTAYSAILTIFTYNPITNQMEYSGESL